MIKVSLLVMLLLTVVIGMGLRWRQDRMPQVAATRRRGLVARGKARIDLWVTAAAIATLATILLIGGLHWVRVFFE
ncbi:MAG TPA: hypothetical protein VNZ61_10995 [Roseomonas sp.]|nr:hypothetical protein [Roseomonas sp.]